MNGAVVKTFKVIFSILSRVVALAGLPVFLIILLGYCLISLIIDGISELEDYLNLSETKASTRATDRDNKRRHKELDLIVDYLKFIFVP